MRVIGTAGHVDHGKSALVEAITGTHPDRLKEEQEREMTIDLGFAWVELPSGEEIGIVDVPGHRDFIENMLAGIGGIDAALFVVAADEGVMPQTKEHLAILDLLEINGGVIALTKIDLVDDQDWLDLIEGDIRRVVSGTVLEHAAIVRVSARTGENVSGVIEAIDACLIDRTPRIDLSRPRLPVDRVFTIAGFGTVVTGTLIDGSLSVGDDVRVLPGGRSARIRGLQTHKRAQDRVESGSRTAINLSGINVEDISRGDVVALPDTYSASRRIDVHFRLLPDVSNPIKHNIESKLFIGSAEVIARIRLLGEEILKPGENGWLQLELQTPVVVTRGDRFILRRPSPGETLGGGRVLDPHPNKRHKRFSESLLARLTALTVGDPADIVNQTLNSLQVASYRDLIDRTNLDQAIAREAIDALIDSGEIINLSTDSKSTDIQRESLLMSQSNWGRISERMIAIVGEYHQNFALRRGIPKEELRSRIKVNNNVFNAVLRRMIADGLIAEGDNVIHHPNHEVIYSAEEQKKISNLNAKLAESPFAPPSIKECVGIVGEEIYNALIDSGELTQVSSQVVFASNTYEDMVAQIADMLAREGTITVAQVRDLFQTSRRYILALMEYLDSIGFTVREGDVRRLKNARQ